MANVSTIAGLVNNIVGVLQALVILVIALAIAYFLYGIAKYILKYGDEAARNESVKIMTHGIIALFVMVAVWGLTELILSLIGKRISLPQFSVIRDYFIG